MAKNKDGMIPNDISAVEVRMRCVEAIVETAAKYGINDPNIITVKADILEKYVMDGYDAGKGDNKTQQKPAKKKDILD